MKFPLRWIHPVFLSSLFLSILGVQKQTTNHGVLLELGRTPLYIQAAKQAIKNWERIRISKANPLLLAAYRALFHQNQRLCSK